MNKVQDELYRERKKWRSIEKDLENTRKELDEATLHNKIKDAEIVNLKKEKEALNKIKNAEIERLKKENEDLKVKLHELQDQNSDILKTKGILTKKVKNLNQSVKTKSVKKLTKKLVVAQENISELKSNTDSKSRQIGNTFFCVGGGDQMFSV